MDLTTEAGVVEHGARIFERVEGGAAKLGRDVLKIGAIVDAGHKLGMAGALQSGEMAAEVRAIAGLIADAERRVYALHRACTDIAKAKGVDLPQPRGGGDR